MLIGELFKERRIELKLNKSQLAKLANISRPTLNNIENNKKSADLESMAKVADALDRQLYITLKKKG